MSEHNYAFRARLRTVHRPHRRMPFAVKGPDRVEIDGSWSIVLRDTGDPVLYQAARDLEDYFAVSMDVFVGFNTPAGHTIEYRVDPALGEQAFRLRVTPDGIVLSGGTARLCARAGYHLEDVCNLAEGPFVPLGERTLRPLYRPRMIHSGYGIDDFPDAYLNQVAHGGFTSLLIYVEDLEHSHRGYTDFNDLIERAARFGLDVYAYSSFRSEVYPEGEEGLRFYDSLYGDLFRRFPGLAGVVFVGESVEFPSRDPHTSGMLRRQNIGPDGKRLVDKVSPGWWPCEDFPVWLNMVKSVIRKEKPDADIVFWTYNWGYAEEKYRLALIDALPTDISLLVTFEMFEDLTVDGVPARTVDYALFFEGPGRYFISEAQAAARRGIRLYAMTNTAGLAWDVGVIPYMPAPYQWAKRHAAMRRAHDDWGLGGLMESHHYGWYPSFISDAARLVFDDPDADEEAVLRALAVRDFSADTADSVLEAWAMFSEGARKLVSNHADQYGPLRVGPAYPLLLRDGFTFRSPRHAVHGLNRITQPLYAPYWKFDVPDVAGQIDAERRLLEQSARLFDQGADRIEAAARTIHPSKQEDAQRLAGLARFIARSVTTAVNTKRWYVLRLALDGAEDKRAVAAKMIDLARQEIENARRAIPLVRADSRLGYEPSMEYMADERHILDKIEATERVIEEELRPLT